MNLKIHQGNETKCSKLHIVKAQKKGAQKLSAYYTVSL
jgi:hypothetical protein